MKRFIQIYWKTILIVMSIVGFIAYSHIVVSKEDLEVKFKAAQEMERYKEDKLLHDYLMKNDSLYRINN